MMKFLTKSKLIDIWWQTVYHLNMAYASQCYPHYPNLVQSGVDPVFAELMTEIYRSDFNKRSLRKRLKNIDIEAYLEACKNFDREAFRIALDYELPLIREIRWAKTTERLDEVVEAISRGDNIR